MYLLCKFWCIPDRERIVPDSNDFLEAILKLMLFQTVPDRNQMK